jgi:hypothetical protein
MIRYMNLAQQAQQACLKLQMELNLLIVKQFDLSEVAFLSLDLRVKCLVFDWVFLDEMGASD